MQCPLPQVKSPNLLRPRVAHEPVILERDRRRESASSHSVAIVSQKSRWDIEFLAAFFRPDAVCRSRCRTPARSSRPQAPVRGETLAWVGDVMQGRAAYQPGHLASPGKPELAGRGEARIVAAIHLSTTKYRSGEERTSGYQRDGVLVLSQSPVRRAQIDL